MGSQYATPDLLQNAINVFSLIDVTPTQQAYACTVGNAEADGFLSGRYALPIAEPFDPLIVHHALQLAVFYLLDARGYQPDAGADARWKPAAEVSREWFRNVQRQNIHPAVVPAVAQPGDPIRDLPQVISQPQRGWQTYSRSGIPSVW